MGLISAGTTTQLAIDSTQADIIKGLGFGESLVMLILTALLAIIIIICGFFIIYTVYFRFLKILIIVPLGAIACSTMAGNRMVSHTMATYCKYFLSCVFEAVTMALAIVVCNAFINAGLPAFTGSYADWAQTLIYLCEMTFTIAMTVGSVKGAQTLTSKAAYIFHCKRGGRWRYRPSSLQVYRSYGFCLCGNPVCGTDCSWWFLFL